MINDGSHQKDLQLVIGADSAAFSVLTECLTGAAIAVEGNIHASPGKGQAWEIGVHSIEMIGSCSSDYPLQKKGHGLEFLREISHIRPRSNTFGAVFRVRNALAQLVHQFFQDRGFNWVQTPIITASDSEGAGELFRVTTLSPGDEKKAQEANDFFGKKAYLTVSGQLNAECLAMSLGRVYTFGPTFRAENSNTTRHLSEFWMVEPEVAFADLNDDMILAEEFLRYIFAEIPHRCEDELNFFHKFYQSFSNEELEQLAKEPFARVSYGDAIGELKKEGKQFQFPVEWGCDLQTEHERYLTDELFKKPVIVTDYPKNIKAFYMRLNDDDQTVAAMDVLVPKIGEIIGGSQREDRYDVLKERLEELNLSKDELQWYLDLRRFGGAPHSGFGLGFERLVQYVTGMANIRDVIPFPRAPGLITF